MKRNYGDDETQFINDKAYEGEIYCIGDKVMHPAAGACYINDIISMTCNKVKKEYYKLAPFVEENMLIYIPVLNTSNIKIRRVMTESEIDKMSLKIKESNINWISDNKERQGLLESTIKSGDVLQLGKLIRMMLERDRENTLQGRDKDLLRSAQKFAYSEIAIVQGKSFEEVTDSIRKEIN